MDARSARDLRGSSASPSGLQIKELTMRHYLIIGTAFLACGYFLIGRVDTAISHLGTANAELKKANAQLLVTNHQIEDMKSKLAETSRKMATVNEKLEQTNVTLTMTNDKFVVLDQVMKKFSFLRK
jgi:peptidoglycan hydrolase CwlO-like protein